MFFHIPFSVQKEEGNWGRLTDGRDLRWLLCKGHIKKVQVPPALPETPLPS